MTFLSKIMIKLYKTVFYKRSLLASLKLLLFCIILLVTSFFILVNFWWFIDCKFCFGQNCGQSVCENYKNHKCLNQCYKGNQINDKNIKFKISEENINSSFRYDSQLIWQKINEYGIRVYSAFKTEDNVIILAQITNEQNNDYSTQFECLFVDENKNQILGKSDAIFEKFKKNFNYYVSTRITCRSHPNSQYVKLVHKNKSNVRTNYIYINYNSEKGSSQNEIIVCVRPLFGPYESIRAMLEFIAYYRINGINKFIIYNESISTQVLQLLKSMTDFVEIIPWNSSDGLKNRSVDQFSSIDDCLHRFEDRVILFIDIDEYIIPFSHQTLKELIINERKDTAIAALSLLNVFFCCEFNTNTQSFPRVLNQLNRQSTIWSKGFRSKIIVLRTELVDKVGIHAVDRLLNKNNITVNHIDENDALMFHYRSCCDVERTPVLSGLLSLPTIRDSVIRDERMTKFSEKIIQFIENYIYL